MGLQTAITREWLKLYLTAADVCAVFLDPRPDLAVPARRVRGRYGWWW
jgi:hypothetical protein